MKGRLGLLGRYENFPEVIHGVARLSFKFPMKKVRQAILCVLQQLNQEVCSLNVITPHLQSDIEVSFEVGVAEDVGFNYLDKEELDRFQKSMVEKELSLLDFFCVVRYHVVKDRRKRVPLKFDYHMLRFTFQENSMELQICHERGTQRVPLEDLIAFITKRINEELFKKRLKPLSLEYFTKPLIKWT
ncbi:MAG: hypothetical protein AOA66_0502 [Candidatus Bathyarchaeota archaeon BA2]|nr:MAG: hypothetical protein AOA66_0502 [Candidatus Bathyarchaeota archaeon BA2]